MYHACEEHIELAIDIIVDEEEQAPIMNQLTEQQQQSTKCCFCEHKAIYEITT